MQLNSEEWCRITTVLYQLVAAVHPFFLVDVQITGAQLLRFEQQQRIKAPPSPLSRRADASRVPLHLRRVYRHHRPRRRRTPRKRPIPLRLEKLPVRSSHVRLARVPRVHRKRRHRYLSRLRSRQRRQRVFASVLSSERLRLASVVHSLPPVPSVRRASVIKPSPAPRAPISIARASAHAPLAPAPHARLDLSLRLGERLPLGLFKQPSPTILLARLGRGFAPKSKPHGVSGVSSRVGASASTAFAKETREKMRATRSRARSIESLARAPRAVAGAH